MYGQNSCVVSVNFVIRTSLLGVARFMRGENGRGTMPCALWRLWLLTMQALSILLQSLKGNSSSPRQDWIIAVCVQKANILYLDGSIEQRPMEISCNKYIENVSFCHRIFPINEKECESECQAEWKLCSLRPSSNSISSPEKETLVQPVEMPSRFHILFRFTGSVVTSRMYHGNILKKHYYSSPSTRSLFRLFL
jgi:prepilin-type processing-associated H-X9-DG protein